MEEFYLFNVPINIFSNKIDGTMTSSAKLKKELKMKFPDIFSEGLEVKENVMPVFRPKRAVPSVSVEIGDKELERLEKLGIIEKTDYCPWAAPAVYVKK